MTTRLFVDAAEVALAQGASAELPEAAAHHALRVLRLRDGDAVTLFDGTAGEWRATIAAAGRRGATVAIGAPVLRSHSARSTAQPRLCFEPCAGLATKSRCDPLVMSQKSLVIDHGR